jgi:hypothetical protein
LDIPPSPKALLIDLDANLEAVKWGLVGPEGDQYYVLRGTEAAVANLKKTLLDLSWYRDELYGPHAMGAKVENVAPYFKAATKVSQAPIVPHDFVDQLGGFF